MSQRVTILGAGESGTGAAVLARSKGFSVFVSDAGTIRPSHMAELVALGCEVEQGSHTLERILQADLLIKSPGIPESAAVVQAAKAQGIEVIDEIEFGFRFLTGTVIAITGTNGKTTTTLLVYHLLQEAGYHVALAGNVGKSLARQVAYGTFDWYVIEVSSFQLDGTTTFRPSIGILLNITPDHLDRYEYQMSRYIDSKFRLVRQMDASDYFIYYADDAVLQHEVPARSLRARQIPIHLQQKRGVFAEGDVMHFREGSYSFTIAQRDTTLRGPHNLINTMAAGMAALLAGVPEALIRKALRTFVNAPHRLEPVGEIDGITFINDSKATNVDSVVYALDSFTQPLVWVAGGIDKGNDYQVIEDAVQKKVHTLICLGKDNTKLMGFFREKIPVILETQSVRELVQMALAHARAGDVVLLSPACASFDLFRNYEDRGTQFREAVKAIKQERETAAI